MADISKITLPSGTTYDIKDAVARQMLSGLTFIIAWDGTGTPTASNLPEGVVAGGVTGTLAPDDENANPRAFYLVKSATTLSSEGLDNYDEYVIVKPDTNDSDTWYWEKIGDTKLNLTDVVTGVTLNKQTASVIGSSSTFKITQPTIALATGATAGTGVISVATGITSASASGDSVTALTGLGSPTTKNVIGASSTFTITQPTIAMALADSSATGKVGVITGVSASTTKIKATASGTGVGWDDKDEVTALTGLGTPSTSTVLTGVKVTTQPTIALSTGATAGTGVISVATGASGTTKYVGGTASGGGTAWNSKDSKTVVTGYASPTSDTFMKSVSPTTTNIKATASGGGAAWNSKDSKTVVTGYASPTTTTVVNNNWTVTNEVLTVGTTSVMTGLGSPSTASVIGASSTFTNTQPTVALSTGATAGTGVVSVATGLGTPTTASALTGLGSPSTASVIGASSTFTNTQPTIALSLADTSATGKVGVITAVTPTTTNIKATASGTAVGANGTASAVTGYPNVTSDTTIGTDATFTVTNPTVTISSGSTGDVTVATNASGTTKYIGGTASGANTAWNSKDTVAAVTGYASPTTDTVLGTGSTITVTPTTTNIKATASGAKTEWNSKDAKTVLTQDSSITVTKAQ